jgi:hypothetical protein
MRSRIIIALFAVLSVVIYFNRGKGWFVYTPMAVVMLLGFIPLWRRL